MERHLSNGGKAGLVAMASRQGRAISAEPRDAVIRRKLPSMKYLCVRILVAKAEKDVYKPQKAEPGRAYYTRAGQPLGHHIRHGPDRLRQGESRSRMD